MSDTDARFAGPGRHLAVEAVIRQMVNDCPDLRSVLDEDAELIGDLPCLQLASIARALVNLAKQKETACVRRVMEIAEEVLTQYGQEGRDYVGACLFEGIPTGGEAVLWPFAGPVTRQFMQPFLS